MGYKKYLGIIKTRWIIPPVVLFVIIFFAALTLTVVAPQSAHAAGAIGSSAGPGGGVGGAQTRYGYGWYMFNTDGSGGSPSGLRDGGTWGYVQNTCRSQNANTIAAFIVQTAQQNVQTSVVYKYTSSFGTYYRYLGGGAAPWQSYTTTQNEFNSLPSQGVSTTGYTFGGPNGNVAWFCYGFQPKNWNITPSVAIDKTTASPGDKVTWTHAIKNSGAVTSSAIKYGYDLASNYTTSGPLAVNASASWKSTYTVTQGDVGKTLCRVTVASPGSNTNGGSVSSASACFTVSYNYALTPTVTLDQSNGSVGTPVSVTSQVTNSGPTQSKATDWQVTEFIVLPNKAIPNAGGGTSLTAPCAYFVANVVSCTSPYNGDSGSGVVFGVSVNALVGTSYIMTDLPVGTHVCFALSVKPNSSSSSDYRHSVPVCVVVGKKPKIQIHGGDLIVGRPFNSLSGPTGPSVINTSTSVKEINGNKYTFGSWIEYGIFAVGTVSGAGSGSAFAGSGLENSTVCNYSTLTFVNATTSNPATNCSDTGTIGGYSSGLDIPNVAANFPISSSTPVYNNTTPNPQGVYQADANNDPITVSAKNIAKGQWAVINAPNADVTITGDIKYDNSALQSIHDIPQMVIIAKDIYIAPNVKQVDSWLIAQGSQTANTGILDTCHISTDYTTPLTVSTCNSILQVNGPVMAQHLWLRRTGGSGTGSASGDPAEVFNLRPDAYLWSFARASVTGHIDTVYTQELPPRF